MAKYDAVVVGAGNSGMIAAIRLQLAGKKHC
jgi:Phytoene dehydrogenase and related proteins